MAVVSVEIEAAGSEAGMDILSKGVKEGDPGIRVEGVKEQPARPPRRERR